VNQKAAVAIALLLFLAGCRGDVTFRFDLRGDGTALATTTEAMDDQLYRLAMNQSINGDPFGIERLQREGWTVSRSVDESGNHIIAMRKLLTRDDLNNVGSAAAALRGGAPPLSSIQFSRVPGFFVEQDSLAATVPALLPFALATVNRRYGDLASAILGSVVAVHFELKAPGKILETNGETTPYGFVRWDLSFQAPTKILYTVRSVHFGRIIAIALIALALLLLAISGLNRRFVARPRG